MTAALVVGALAVVGAVVARVTWRRPADERHSIEVHQQTLATLRSMADRRSNGSPERSAAPGPEARPAVARNGAAARPARNRAATSVPPRPAPGRPAPGRPAPGRPAPGPLTPRPPVSSAPPDPVHDDGRAPLVFVDDAATAASSGSGDRPAASFVAVRGLSAGHQRRRSLGPRHRAGGRSLVPAVAAVVVIGLVVAVVVAVLPEHHGGAKDRPLATHRPTTSRPPRTTTTTAPARFEPTAATAATAAYVAPVAPYTVGLQATTGACWIEATETATGTVLWSGTLQPGQTRSVAATGGLLLRLGAANDVSVTVNGEPVAFPSGFQSPFDMTFHAA